MDSYYSCVNMLRTLTFCVHVCVCVSFMGVCVCVCVCGWVGGCLSMHGFYAPLHVYHEFITANLSDTLNLASTSDQRLVGPHLRKHWWKPKIFHQQGESDNTAVTLLFRK
jgi:hypothetical protein